MDKVYFPLPSIRLQLKSTLSPDQILSKLSELKEKKKFYFIGDRQFHGSVIGNHFEFKREINYRHGFLPIVAGAVTPATDGSIIDISMRMRSSARVFLLFWLSGVSASLLLSLTMQPALANVVPALMLAFGLLLPNIGFHPEAKRALEFLWSTLNAVEV